MKQRSQDEPQVCSEQLGECSCVTWDRGPAGYRGTLCGLGVSQRCQQNVQVKALSGRLDIACCLGDRSQLAAKAGCRLQRDHLALWVWLTSGPGEGPRPCSVRGQGPSAWWSGWSLEAVVSGDAEGCPLGFTLPPCPGG